MGRVLVTAMCSVALGLGVAACGDDDEGDTGGGGNAATTQTTPALTKAQWIERADAICKASEAQADALEPEGEDPQVIADAIGKLGPVVEKQRNDLAALGTPAEIKPQVDEALSLLERQQALLPRIQTAVRDNDAQAAQQATQDGDELEKRLDALAKEIGLTECGDE